MKVLNENELLANIKTNEFLNDYALTIASICRLYKRIVGGMDNKILLNNINMLRNEDRYNSALNKIILNEMIETLTNGNKVDYEMYFKTVFPNMNNVKPVNKIDTKEIKMDEDNYYNKPSKELIFLFQLLGVKQTAYMLLLFNSIR